MEVVAGVCANVKDEAIRVVEKLKGFSVLLLKHRLHFPAIFFSIEDMLRTKGHPMLTAKVTP